METTHKGISSFLVIMLAIVTFIGFMAVRFFQAMPQVEIPSYTDHATDRHADVLSPAVSCFSGEGTISNLVPHNDTKGRSAWMCQLSDGSMFVWIIDDLTQKTVTMFKNKGKTFERVVEYLKNQGYTLPTIE